MAALRRQTPDVRLGFRCLHKEVKLCDHHEMVVTPYGIYPWWEHGSVWNVGRTVSVCPESIDLGKRNLNVEHWNAPHQQRICRRNVATVVCLSRTV